MGNWENNSIFFWYHNVLKKNDLPYDYFLTFARYYVKYKQNPYRDDVSVSPINVMFCVIEKNRLKPVIGVTHQTRVPVSVATVIFRTITVILYFVTLKTNAVPVTITLQVSLYFVM